MMPPPAVPAGMHRGDMVLHSPVGHLQTAGHHAYPHQQQQAHYGAPHDLHGHARSYHHPDTPGGPDVRPNAHPFAFFKSPLGGAPINHPSAYGQQPQQQAGGRQAGPATSGSSTHQAVRPLGIRERRAVPPAVSGLSVRTVDSAHSMGERAPQSAPVDGPAHGKRKISHDEVIMALRRKVMSKGAHVALAAEAAAPSSLAVITSAASDEERGGGVELRVVSSSSSTSSSSSGVSVAELSAGGEASGQQRRLPSISAMLDTENGSGSANNGPDAAQEQQATDTTNGKTAK
ncbi:hypothetical protein GGI05_005096 [Coemansia sp. RSA 2603]|nr:hypothetical protein GGI05_005096 [Coemansia sp. RSA 2603]